jgi:hypothetical protein
VYSILGVVIFTTPSFIFNPRQFVSLLSCYSVLGTILFVPTALQQKFSAHFAMESPQ